MQLFIDVVNTQLLELVELEVLESEDIEQSHCFGCLLEGFFCVLISALFGFRKDLNIHFGY